jgi:hypothetical protein
MSGLYGRPIRHPGGLVDGVLLCGGLGGLVGLGSGGAKAQLAGYAEATPTLSIAVV